MLELTVTLRNRLVANLLGGTGHENRDDVHDAGTCND